MPFDWTYLKEMIGDKINEKVGMLKKRGCAALEKKLGDL